MTWTVTSQLLLLLLLLLMMMMMVVAVLWMMTDHAELGPVIPRHITIHI